MPDIHHAVIRVFALVAADSKDTANRNRPSELHPFIQYAASSSFTRALSFLSGEFAQLLALEEPSISGVSLLVIAKIPVPVAAAYHGDVAASAKG
jgi:hypothetical protein